MLNKIRLRIIEFINGKGTSIGLSIIAALAAGLFPVLFYYDRNFSQVNSWGQFAFFIVSFLFIPCVVFCAAYLMFNSADRLKKYSKYILPIFNYCLFVFLSIISTFGINSKILPFALLFALGSGILFYAQFRKVIVFQLLLGLLIIPKLLPEFHAHFTYSKEWMLQPDDIENVKFNKKPNIYVIQPDGYANFSELRKNIYNYDNSEFEGFLNRNSFELYEGFRSNYRSTLSSNSSMFAMKHHYYNMPNFGIKELYNSREVIVGKNPVNSIFKNNNYKTFLILEESYLLVNRPKIFYDYCNFSYDELPYLNRGFAIDKNVEGDVKKAIRNNKSTNNFYFIEKLLPSHISNAKYTKGKEIERLEYLQNLKESNNWLQNLISMIIENDANCLIVIVSDHGGYVGLDSTSNSLEKQIDDDLIYSIFTSALAIRWSDEVPRFDDELKSNVNLFRVLFSYLSDDETYMDNLQEDKSYAVINKGTPFGVYEYIDERGDVVFRKISD